MRVLLPFALLRSHRSIGGERHADEGAIAVRTFAARIGALEMERHADEGAVALRTFAFASALWR